MLVLIDRLIFSQVDIIHTHIYNEHTNVVIFVQIVCFVSLFPLFICISIEKVNPKESVQ
jgi:hypothetical membrane protein